MVTKKQGSENVWFLKNAKKHRERERERERERKFREFDKTVLAKEKSKKPRKQKEIKNFKRKCDQTNFKKRVF
jgi:hypothetical protein